MKPITALGVSLAILTTAASFPVLAAEKTVPEQNAEKFFEMLNSESSLPAYKFIFSGSAFEKRTSELETLATQTDAVFLIHGKVSAVELIDREELTPSVIRLRYVAKTRDMPLVYRMIFYRTGQDWRAVYVYFDDLVQNAF